MEAKHHEDHDYSITPVGAEGKKGFASMLVIMLGFTFYKGTMLTGGQLGTNLTFKSLVVVLLVGDLILGLYTAILSYISAKTSLSTHLLARYSFGLNETSLSLEAYFHCNENMKDTAEYIYSHPNTIKYRLQRIEEICGRSLENSKDKLELQVSLYIMQVLHIGE